MRTSIARARTVRPSLAFAVLALAAPGVVTPGPAAAQAVTATPHSVHGIEEPVSALAFSSDGDRILAGGSEGALVLLDLEADRTLWAESAESTASVAFTAFLAGDTAVVSVDEEGVITVRSARTGRDPHVMQSAGTPERVALDDARRVLAVAGEGRIELFDLPTRQRVGLIDARGEVEEPLFLGFDRRGRQLLAVAEDGGVTAWNPATLEPLRRVSLEGGEIYGSRSVVHAVGQDRSANILVLALEEVALPRGGVAGRRARPGDLVREHQLLIFDWYSGAEIRRVPVTDGSAEVLAVGPGNDHAVVAHDDQVTIMDLRAGERGAGITAPAEVRRLAISLDQDRLAIGTTEGDVAVWEVDYREPAVAEALDAPPEGIRGRLRVLGDDSPAITPEEPIVLAVLPFDDRDRDGRMSQTVAELLTTQLANVEHLTLVERLRIQDLIDEQDLQREGLTEAGGLELGRLLSADYVLLGSVGASGSSFTFSARLLDVETGQVVSGRQVLCEDCRAQDLFEAIHLLGTTVAR